MQILDIQSKHWSLELWIYSPFMKLEYYIVHWLFREVFNIHLHYAPNHLFIKFTSVILCFEFEVWNERYIKWTSRDWTLFKPKPNANDEVFERLGFVEKEASPEE